MLRDRRAKAKGAQQMTKEYIVMSRSTDSSRQDMPTLMLVDIDCPDHWLILTGTDLMQREAVAEKQFAQSKKYRVTIEEVSE